MIGFAWLKPVRRRSERILITDQGATAKRYGFEPVGTGDPDSGDNAPFDPMREALEEGVASIQNTEAHCTTGEIALHGGIRLRAMSLKSSCG
jgi:hypothetical protein